MNRDDTLKRLIARSALFDQDEANVRDALRDMVDNDFERLELLAEILDTQDVDAYIAALQRHPDIAVVIRRIAMRPFNRIVSDYAMEKVT